jgi:hypothetical protein
MEQNASMDQATGGFIKKIRNPFYYRFFLIRHLPTAFFSGLRILEMDGDHSVVSVPYKWFTRNPFRSTYFASLSMAAEMSTGVLAMAHLYQRKPPVSMLIISMSGSFIKKATGTTRFYCREGHNMKQAIEEADSTGSPSTIKVKSEGYNDNNELVAVFEFTWSFRRKVNR